MFVTICQINLLLSVDLTVSLKLDMARRRKNKVDPLYKTDVWHSLTDLVFRKYGKRCLSCGIERGPIFTYHILSKTWFPHLQLDIRNLQVLQRFFK